jgi:chorismate mutase / prephenate dehydratase
MPNPGSAFDVSPAASAKEEPSSQDDGWRQGSGARATTDLAALRAELDRIDNAVHDLFMQRAKVVEQVARSGKPAAFRPGREASIVRRLVQRHHGSLPPLTLFRVWRELLAGTTAMQGRFAVAVSDADVGAELTQLAREHFGALTPLYRYGNAGQALTEVGRGAVSVAILPIPSDTDTWWVALPRHEPRLYVVGRLPFWQTRPDGAPAVQALVVAAAPPDASGDDRTFVGLECSSDVSRIHASDALTAAGLAPNMLVLARDPASAATHVLAEFHGSVAEDDARLHQLRGILHHPVVIGGYAEPFADIVR